MNRWMQAAGMAVVSLMIVSSLGYAEPILINGRPGSDFDAGDAVVVDAEDNVIVAGYLQTTATTAALTIIKFGPDRSEIWRRVLGDIPSGFLGDAADRTLALDRNCHVIVVGSVVRPGTGTDFFVAKLDKETGAPWWQPMRISGADNSDNRATAVAVDAENHILAVGFLGDANANSVFFAVKIDSETGAEIWRRSLPSSPGFALDQAHAVAVMRNNDVAVAGLLSGHFGVVRLNATTGMVQPGWPQIVIGTANSAEPRTGGLILLYAPLTRTGLRHAGVRAHRHPVHCCLPDRGRYPRHFASTTWGTALAGAVLSGSGLTPI